MSDIVLIFGIFCLAFNACMLTFAGFRVVNNLFGNTKELGDS